MRTILLFAAMTAAAVAQPNPSNLAAGVLDQTSLARQSVAARDSAAALDHVRRGLATVSAIQQASPGSTAPLMVPMAREVETTTTVTPVKHHNPTELKHNSSIRGVEESATATLLNVTAAGERLQAAETALENSNWVAADAALAAVQNAVTTGHSAGAAPLDMARSNLDLARARIEEGKYRDAEVPLRSAAQALEVYQRQCMGQKAADVESARLAILDYSSHIGHDRDAALARIDGWSRVLGEWR